MSSPRPKPDRAPLITLLRMRAEGEPADSVILECFAFIGERLASIPNDEREELLDRGDLVMAASLDEELRADGQGGDALWCSRRLDDAASDILAGDDEFVLIDQRDIGDREIDDAGEDRQEEREVSSRRALRSDLED